MPNRRTQLLPAALIGMALLCPMPAWSDHDDDREWERNDARYESDRSSKRIKQAAFIGDRAADHALRMTGIPYRYGGNSPSSGFDCSGLVQFSYGRAGVRLPRTTDALRQASSPVRPAGLRRGDLVFFHQPGKRNGHVGMYLGGGEFIHAPSSGGSVRRDSLHSPYWRKHFSQARRIAA